VGQRLVVVYAPCPSHLLRYHFKLKNLKQKGMWPRGALTRAFGAGAVPGLLHAVGGGAGRQLPVLQVRPPVGAQRRQVSQLGAAAGAAAAAKALMLPHRAEQLQHDRTRVHTW
jgi:hypothetical protein